MTPEQLAPLLPYQRRWVNDFSPVKVCEKSRRVGITWAEAAERTLSAAQENGMDAWYIGYNREMALEFVETAAMWARRFNRAAEAIEQIVVADEDRDLMAWRLRFASGHKIVALSSRPSNLRGKDGCAVIDEAAFHGDLAGLLKAALAFTMWGGRVHIISTHNGDANAFNELVNDIRAGRRPFSLHRVTLDDAIADGLYRKICETSPHPQRGAAMRWSAEGERRWRRQLVDYYGENAGEELFCIPRAGSGAFLPTILIENRMRAQAPVIRWAMGAEAAARGEEWRRKASQDFCQEQLDPCLAALDPELMTCFGEDFARSGDLTVIWPLQLMPNLVRRTPFVLEMRDVPFREQERILFHIVDRLPRFIAGAMDARGNGQYIAEQAALRYGERIEQVMLSIEWYREHMPRYKAAFEDGTIELPRDADILADHRALRIEDGVARVPEKRTAEQDSYAGLSNKRHGDSAIAGALAYHASYLRPAAYDYRPAPGRGVWGPE
ncbi:MAG: hypothetical protein WA005_13875, partial [Candidatus Binataceae bacterium]